MSKRLFSNKKEVEIKFMMSNKEFHDKVIREIARQILEHKGMFDFSWMSPEKGVLRTKAINLLKIDKAFDKIITKKLKEELSNKKNIQRVAKEILEEKLRD